MIRSVVKRRYGVSTSFRSRSFSRLAGALGALWLCGAGAAWAGDGADLASLNQLFTGSSGLCAILKLTTCYQLPTITQAMLEVAGLTNSPPEMVAAQNNIAPGYNAISGNPATAPYAPNFLPISFPLPAASTTSTTVSELLSTLTPIAFASQNSGTGTAVATQLYDPAADTFLYAVAASSEGATGAGGLTNADTVYFFYDDLFRVAQTFTKGQIVAKFSFPLTVLNSHGTENPAVMTTLQITSCANGLASCFMVTAAGDFLGNGMLQTLGTGSCLPAPAAAVPPPIGVIGVNCAVVFSASPTWKQKHAIFEVAVPLLVTGASPTSAYPPFTAPLKTDPPYFFSAITGQPGNVSTAPSLTGNFSIYTAFGAGVPPDDLGAVLPPGILPAPAYSIGLAPTAGSPSSFTFALCATLPDNSNGPAAHRRSAVGAYYVIATGGETYLGAPLNPTIPSICPAL